MAHRSLVAGLLRALLNVGGALLLLQGLNYVFVVPSLATLVNTEELGGAAKFGPFYWRMGIVSLLSGAGGLFFANIRRVPLLSRHDVQVGAGAGSSRFLELVGLGGMGVVCLWVLAYAGSLAGLLGVANELGAGPVAGVFLVIAGFQFLALSGFVILTLAHLWLARVRAERGTALALSSACVQTGVVARAYAFIETLRVGTSALASASGGQSVSAGSLPTAHIIFVASLLTVAWSRR